MANELTAAVVTAVPRFPANLGKTQLRGLNKQVEVTMEITVTTTASLFNYVAGGIPLDNLFTNGSSDSGLDPFQKITQVGPAFLRKSATVLTPMLMASFFQGTPSTNVNQTLVLYTCTPAAGDIAFRELGTTSADLRDATAFSAAGPLFCVLTLKGFWRPGTTAGGID